MRRLPDPLREALLGLVLVAALLLLGELARELRNAGGTELTVWAAVVEAGVGALVLLGALRARRSPLAPAIAAGLLAWPLLVLLWDAVPDVPAWLPLLDDAATSLRALPLVVGVFATAAATGARG